MTEEEHPKQTTDVLGQEMDIQVPPGAMTTGVLMMAEYTWIGEDGKSRSGTCWAASKMGNATLVGMSTMLANQVTDYVLNPEDDGE